LPRSPRLFAEIVTVTRPVYVFADHRGEAVAQGRLALDGRS
jgi:hypothetical protein